MSEAASRVPRDEAAAGSSVRDSAGSPAPRIRLNARAAAQSDLPLESPSRELWAAVHLPALMLDALMPDTLIGRDVSADAAVAVVERIKGVQRIVAVNAPSRDRGLSCGMAYTAALALEPRLVAATRDPKRETQLLERLAERCVRFTPRVSIESPDGLVLEVRGSLNLFGGAAALCTAIEDELRAAGAQPQLALAPTPLGALCGARAGQRFIVEDRAAFVGSIAPLPLTVLRFPEDTVQRLASAGVRSIGQVLRLPRTGFARRFGRRALDTLDRLAGRAPEMRRAFQARERFRSRIEPAYELTHLDAVLAFLEPGIATMEDFLRSRQAGITALTCRLRHREHETTVYRLGFARPAFEAAAIVTLLAERLANMTLPAPVIACELRSSLLVANALASDSLWKPGEHGGTASGQAAMLVERLRARFGSENVHGLAVVAEHRPEAAWCVAEPRQEAPACAQAPASKQASASTQAPARTQAPAQADIIQGALTCGSRPLWLLREPQCLEVANGRPRHAGSLRLIDGPERLETGWWDGGDISRDYYVARDARGGRLWIYRERLPPHRWFLHGLFG